MMIRLLQDGVATRLFPLAGTLGRLVRPTLRPQLLAARRARRLRRESADWSEERRRDWVLEQLRLRLRRAARSTPWWAERFRDSGFDPDADFGFDDFARLPILEREELAEAGDRLRSREVPPALVRADATGGSTGAPVRIWTGPEERGRREESRLHSLALTGLRDGDRTAFLWGHHLDPQARDRLRDRVRDWLANVVWLDCLRLSPAVLDAHHRALERQRPAAIVAYASSIAALAEHLARRGIRPSYPSTCIVTGAEKLFREQRALVESVFAVPVHERYGGRDVGGLAIQSRPRESADFDVDWMNVLLEPETDDPESPILVTKLHADAMPLVRYRVGDLGRFPAGSRPGHPAFVLHEVLGRETDRLWTPAGAWMHGLSVPHMMKDFPVREFQVEQAEDFAVTISIVPAEGFDADAGEGILRIVRANLAGVPVRLRVVDAIPRTRANKWRPVVSAVARRRSA